MSAGAAARALPLAGAFIDGPQGPLLVVVHRPAAAVRGAVLAVPAFAEEMNKCRPTVTAIARRLADQGYATIVPDLHGTGDSGGEFSQARWEAWLADLHGVAGWAQAQGLPVTGILALRLGARLAADAIAAGSIAPVARTAFCQPVLDARQFLRQFLRLRMAATLGTAGAAESAAQLRARLESEGSLAIAGYRLAAPLARALEERPAPAALPAGLGELAWLETARDAPAQASTRAQELVRRFRGAGSRVQLAAFTQEPFWATTEIVVPREMAAAAAAFLAGAPAGAGVS